MYILGLAGHHRDAAAALLKDGRIVAAIEKEKLSRVRHIGISQAGGLPYEAIAFCLEQAGISIGDVDYVTYYFSPQTALHRQSRFNAELAQGNPAQLSDLNAASLNEYSDRMRSQHLIGRLLKDSSRVIETDHQLAHAASSFYLSGFERAAVLVLSGRGDFISIAAGIGEGRQIRLHKQIAFPHSLGWVYSLVTEYLGFRAGEGENKTQWLSVAGEPEFLSAFREMIRIDQQGIPEVDLSWFDSSLRSSDPFSEKFYRSFGDRLRRSDQRFNGEMSRLHQVSFDEASARNTKAEFPANSYRRNLAHSLQQRLEEVVLTLAEKVRLETGADALCLAGGVALNTLLVSRLEQAGGYQHIFVQPAAGNAGCSFGSALYLWHHHLDQGQPEPLEQLFLGPEYSDQDVKPVLDNCKLTYRCLTTEDQLLSEVVELLCRDNIVGWFQGRAEFGPRSLGARSILASPLRDYMKDNLNIFVKHRESFRPFAASVPEERAEEFFDNCSPLSKFLLTVSRIRADKRELIPAAWFGNGLARVHLVSRKTNPRFWRLLTLFGEKTGVPVLLNTSFNLFGEPVVCTPREAVRSYCCSGIDALVINRFLLRK